MLTAEMRDRGRRRLLWFGLYNALSFTLLTGNLISLYLLRLGATNALIGVVSSFQYISFFMLFLGRRLVPRVGVMRLFAWAWLWRYVVFLPALVAPVFLLSGSPLVVFALVTAGVLGFNVFRGIGMVAQSPMFSEFAGQSDTGRLLSQFQMIASVVTIGVGIAIAYLLGAEAAVTRYVLFLGLGVAFGLVATGYLFALPELEEQRETARRPLGPVIREMWDRREVRRFFLTFLLVAIASGVGRTFLVVYAKQAHGYTDRLAFLLVAVGSVGNFLAGYLGSILLDRLGARPLLLFSLAAYLLSLIVAIVVPAGASVAIVAAVAFAFLVGTLGYTGNENAGQAYFYGVTGKADRLNLGLIFFFVLGIGGTIGSFAGGVLLDGIAPLVDPVWAFRVLFAATGLVLALALLRGRRLASLGAETFRGTLEVIFSPRDLRTVGLLNRLDRTRGETAERNAIRTIAQSGSPIATAEVLDRLRSPSYAVRQEALDALSSLPWSDEVEAALISHLAEAVHTTAFQAVRILGLRGGPAAIEPVRRSIDSDDPMLADRAIVAYAKLAGREALPELRRRLEHVEHPRRLMYLANATRIAGDAAELPLLLTRLRDNDLPDYVIDEILFAAAALAGIQDRFYPLYSSYVRRRESVEREALSSELVAEVRDQADDPAGRRDRLTAAVHALLDDDDPARVRSLVLEAPPLLTADHAGLAATLPVRGRVDFFLVALALWG